MPAVVATSTSESHIVVSVCVGKDEDMDGGDRDLDCRSCDSSSAIRARRALASDLDTFLRQSALVFQMQSSYCQLRQLT